MKKTILAFYVGCLILGAKAFAAETRVGFASETVDFGVVVSDIEKSVKFYTEGIGFREVPGFTVPADWTKDVGLTDGKDLKIRVLKLGAGEEGTKLKLMQVEGSKPKKGETKHVNSQLGLRYMTIAVTDIDASLARLKKAGYKSASKGDMVELPEGFPKGIYLLVARDPDGNMVELVGPKGAAGR